MSRYYLHTLGHLSLHEGSADGEVLLSDAKALAALAYLATTPDGTGDRSHLAQLLWPRKSRSRARAGLRQALYYLRQKTPGHVALVRSDGERLALDRRNLEVDLREFEEALSREQWARALELYHGTFVGGYSVSGGEEFRHWRESQDDGIRAGAREALRTLVSRALEAGDPQEAVRYARRWVELNPLDEEARSAHVRSLVAAGDRARAFRAYESYRSLLREELGESPGPRIAGALEELRALAGGDEDGPRGRGQEAEQDDLQPDSERRDGRGVRRAAVAAGIAGLVLVVGLMGWGVLGSGGGSGPADGGVADTLVHLACTDEEGNSERRIVRIIGDSAEVTRLERDRPGLPSPDGQFYAKTVPMARGIDLTITDSLGAEERKITDRPDDEHPVAWSPDGRRVIYQAGGVEPDGRYRRRYRVFVIADDLDRSLRLATGNVEASADWSPRGTWIALASDSTGDSDVWIVRPDASDARNLTADHPGFDGDPAWSPDGERLAFVSDRSGYRAIWVTRADGTQPRRVGSGRGSVADPAWLDRDRLAFLRISPGQAELRTLDLSTGEEALLSAAARCTRLVALRRAGETDRWIESVVLGEGLDRASPGQWIPRRVTLRDASGRAISPRGGELRWRSSDTTVVDPGGADDWLRIRGTGEATVTVSVRGWRVDTARIVARPLEALEMAPEFQEDWTAGLDTSRWIPFGDPAAFITEEAGRFPAAAVCNGDENWDSGVVSPNGVGIPDGVTVEAWGRIPFSARLYQSFEFGLVDERPEPGDPSWRTKGERLTLGFGSQKPDSMIVHVLGRNSRIPAPDSLGTWRRYAIQVDSAGRVSVLVDGRLHWRSPRTIDLTALEGTHLALYGRSKDTRILHGPVRLYEGARYRY